MTTFKLSVDRPPPPSPPLPPHLRNDNFQVECRSTPLPYLPLPPHLEGPINSLRANSSHSTASTHQNILVRESPCRFRSTYLVVLVEKQFLYIWKCQNSKQYYAMLVNEIDFIQQIELQTACKNKKIRLYNKQWKDKCC